jgi:glucuronate isomerase
MANPLILHEDRLLPAEPSARAVARQLYASVKNLPIISPHGHTDPEWFANNEAFPNATELLLAPDHYLYRMLYSQGIALERFAHLSGEGVTSWRGYLEAHRIRRAAFIDAGATSTDHGHPTAQTADLSGVEAEALFKTVLSGTATAADAELFRAQMLTEMARMSLDDGLVMQIHPGSFRNHNRQVFERFGRDKGADIPTSTDYVRALKPLLDRFDNEAGLSVILFTLDETAYARELAPLAGHYPILKLGPAWWFHDSPGGMRRFREQTTETAGFHNTVGFNDDTRAFLSIPARHDMSRRVDCGFLARLVVEHRLAEDEAAELAQDLAYNLVKRAYKLDRPRKALAA